MFGLIIGYLSWYAFKPGEIQETVPIQKIAALIAVIAGATILTLFPTGTRLFENYSLGLAIGFFFPPISKWISGIYKVVQNRFEKNKKNKSIELQKEMGDIEEKWLSIDKVVRRKLESAGRIDDRDLLSVFINIVDLQELAYSQESLEYIMKKFSKLHGLDNVSYKVVDGKPALYKKRK